MCLLIFATVRCLLTPEMKRLVRLAAEVPPALDLVLCKDVRDLVKLGLRQLYVSSGEILERTRRLPVCNETSSGMSLRHEGQN